MINDGRPASGAVPESFKRKKKMVMVMQM
eukprot:COSAG02_NODE_42066_length_388_cov_0.871972_2_plen_28_part_01